MRKKFKDRGSLRKLLQDHFILYLIVIMIGVCLWIMITIKGWGHYHRAIQPQEMDKLEEQLIRGNYDSAYFNPYNSYGTFFEIISYEKGLIYSSNKSQKHHFNKKELELILPHDADYYYTSMEYISPESSKQRYLLQKNTHSGSRYVAGVLPVEEEEFAYLLDSQLQVISSASPSKYQSFTKREIEILTQSLEDMYHLYRYDFVTQSGDKRAFIIFKTYDVKQQHQAFYDYMIKNVILLLLAIFLVMLLFIWRLDYIIAKPLETLRKAMTELASRDRIVNYDYSSGPKELVTIFETFNTVSSELYESERLRSELEESRRKLLASISHDLRTPITVIQGYSKALIDKLIIGEAREQYLTIIYQKSNVLNDLINSLYDFSRIQHPDFQLSMEKTDFSEYLRHYWARHYEEFDVSGYCLELDIPEKRYEVMLDQAYFDRILDNLHNNFIKYNPKGTTLYFKIVAAPTELILTIADNGVIISEDTAKSIFNPFVTGSESRTAGHGGTGLGLSIVKQFVEMHGGMIRLENQDDRYSKSFVIRIPLAE